MVFGSGKRRATGKNQEDAMCRKPLFILLSATTFAVIPKTIYAGWTRTYGGVGFDAGRCVEQTDDGGYVITGYTRSFGAGESDLWLLKTDPLGDTVWTKIYGSKNRDWGFRVRQTFDGAYIILGGTFPVDSGLPITWLLKTDFLGDTLWTQTYEGTGSWGQGGNWIEQTTDNGYIITGRKHSDLWLVKLDSLGEILWERSYGGEWYDEGHCVQEASDGGYIVTGYTSSLEEYGHDLWLLKVDDQGDTLWTAAFDDIEGGASEGFVVREKEDGDYMISGVWEIMPMRFALGLFLADEDGYIYPTPQIWVDYDGWYNSMALASDGCVIVASNPEDEAVLIKTNLGGVPRWERTYKGEGHAYGSCVQATSDGGYIIVGSTHPSGAEERDLWLIKTDSLGYVDAVVEDRVVEAPNWKLVTSIGPQIVLRYADHPQGFHASIFDATGRKVDELHATESSGMITWGKCYGCYGCYELGVYFIRSSSGSATAGKVVLVE